MIRSLTEVSFMIPTGQVRSQVPHPVHSFSFTSGKPFEPMVRAPKGQALTQEPRPMQPDRAFLWSAGEQVGRPAILNARVVELTVALLQGIAAADLGDLGFGFRDRQAQNTGHDHGHVRAAARRSRWGAVCRKPSPRRRRTAGKAAARPQLAPGRASSTSATNRVRFNKEQLGGHAKTHRRQKTYASRAIAAVNIYSLPRYFAVIVN